METLFLTDASLSSINDYLVTCITSIIRIASIAIKLQSSWSHPLLTFITNNLCWCLPLLPKCSNIHARAKHPVCQSCQRQVPWSVEELHLLFEVANY